MYGIYYNRTTPFLAFLEGMVRVFDWAALLELRKGRNRANAKTTEDEARTDKEWRERIVSWYIRDAISTFEAQESGKLAAEPMLFRRCFAIANVLLGPMPSQQVILRYEDVVKGALDRIMGMAEDRLERDGKAELELLRQRGRQGYMGMAAGFILAMLLTGGSLYLILSVNAWAGLAIMGVNFALAITASVYVTKAQVRDKLYTRDFFPVKKRKT